MQTKYGSYLNIGLIPTEILYHRNATNQQLVHIEPKRIPPFLSFYIISYFGKFRKFYAKYPIFYLYIYHKSICHNLINIVPSQICCQYSWCHTLAA